VYPAVQNLMLAARALGVGTTITARIHWKRDEAKELLSLPDDVDPLLVIPMGYPAEPDHFGGSRRDAASDHTFYDRWDS
jgi:nitroreductase